MIYSPPGEALTHCKYLHSEEVAQTSHSRCLDTLQPEEITRKNYTSRDKVRADGDFAFLLRFNTFHERHKLVTYHISDVQDLPGHGLFVMGWSWSEPQLLECLIHQFLKGT